MITAFGLANRRLSEFYRTAEQVRGKQRRVEGHGTRCGHGWKGLRPGPSGVARHWTGRS